MSLESLLIASNEGNIEEVQNILNADPSLAVQSQTIIHELIQGCLENNGNCNLKTVKLLLGNWADPNNLDEEGCTPLQRAAESNNFLMAKLLLKWGASINLGEGARPLEIVDAYGYEDIRDVLIRRDRFKIEQLRANAIQLYRLNLNPPLNRNSEQFNNHRVGSELLTNIPNSVIDEVMQEADRQQKAQAVIRTELDVKINIAQKIIEEKEGIIQNLLTGIAERDQHSLLQNQQSAELVVEASDSVTNNRELKEEEPEAANNLTSNLSQSNELNEVSESLDSILDIDRAELINFALENSAEFRHLLAPEIHAALMYTIGWIRYVRNQSESTSTSIYNEIDRLPHNIRHNQCSPLLPSTFFEDEAQAQELSTLLEKYITSREQMFRIVIRCNDELDRKEDERFSLEEMRHFFSEENNQIKYYRLYSIFAKEEILFSPIAQELQNYCLKESTYKKYVKSYSEIGNGFVFLEKDIAERKNTSMIDIAAKKLKRQIIILATDDEKETELYRTAAYGSVLSIQYKNLSCFSKKNVDDPGITQQVIHEIESTAFKFFSAGVMNSNSSLSRHQYKHRDKYRGLRNLRIDNDNWVTIRVWWSRKGKDKYEVMGAPTSADGAILAGGDVGHVSLQTRERYASFWPEKWPDKTLLQAKSSFLGTRGKLLTIFSDEAKHPKGKRKEADIIITLYGLDVKIINNEIDKFRKRAESPQGVYWVLWGRNWIFQNSQSCSGLVYDLLNAGGIMKRYNIKWHGFTNVMVPPDLIAEAILKAKKRECRMYPDTHPCSLAVSIIHPIKQRISADIRRMWKYSMRKIAGYLGILDKALPPDLIIPPPAANNAGLSTSPKNKP